MLTLSLEKPGTATPKLKLSLNKGAQFTVKVEWMCDADHADDVDVHALEARSDGNGAKVRAPPFPSIVRVSPASMGRLSRIGG